MESFTPLNNFLWKHFFEISCTYYSLLIGSSYVGYWIFRIYSIYFWSPQSCWNPDCRCLSLRGDLMIVQIFLNSIYYISTSLLLVNNYSTHSSKFQLRFCWFVHSSKFLLRFCWLAYSLMFQLRFCWFAHSSKFQLRFRSFLLSCSDLPVFFCIWISGTRTTVVRADHYCNDGRKCWT